MFLLFFWFFVQGRRKDGGMEGRRMRIMKKCLSNSCKQGGGLLPVYLVYMHFHPYLSLSDANTPWTMLRAQYSVTEKRRRYGE